MINGTRADQDALAKSMCELSKQHARTVKQLNSALTRLDYYEKHVPWLGDLRRDFDYEQAIGEDAAIEERVRLEHGVIAELTKV